MKKRSIFGRMSLLAVGTSLAVSCYSQSFLTDGLVAYYPFDGNANDASGNGYDGVNYGAVLTTNRFGTAKSAYRFDGVSAFIGVGKLLPDMPSASFSFWIDVSGGGGSHGMVFMDGDGSPQSDFVLDCVSGTDLWFTTKDNVSISLTLPANIAWNHVAGVANGTSNLLYLNGQLVAALPCYGNANVGYHSDFELGRRTVYSDNYFKGVLDDMRLYNRALSSQEVQQLYVFECTKPCRPSRATATAEVYHGFVVGATVTDGGCGYSNAPVVQILGAGTGATATATVSNGSVTQITITDAGYGYSTNTIIRIASPPFAPWVELGVKTVRLTQHVVLGLDYVLESSTDLAVWNQVGSQFTATDEVIIQEFDVDVTGKFFRLRQVP